jgi:hypothetical protein
MGDTSGLSPEELEWLKRFEASLGDWQIADVARDPDGAAEEARFTWSFSLYGGDAQGGDIVRFAALIEVYLARKQNHQQTS